MLLRFGRMARRHKQRLDSKGRSNFSAPDRPLEAESIDQQDIPVCKCGAIVKYAGSHVCEDCFVNMQVRWPGKATRVRIFF